MKLFLKIDDGFLLGFGFVVYGWLLIDTWILAGCVGWRDIKYVFKKLGQL